MSEYQQMSDAMVQGFTAVADAMKSLNDRTYELQLTVQDQHKALVTVVRLMNAQIEALHRRIEVLERQAEGRWGSND